MASGGYRPTAPQNNTGVSSTGGNGSKDGQPNRYLSGGGEYGASKALNDQQGGAKLAAAAPTPTAKSMAPATPTRQLGTLLDDTTNPMEPLTAGSDFGPGPGSEVLPKNLTANTRPDENAAIIANYLPDLIQAASYKDAPDSFKRFVNYLASK